MNTNMLRVMNEIHKLGMKKEHWDMIKEERKRENDFKQSISVIKSKLAKDTTFICVCVDHYKNNDLVIREIERPTLTGICDGDEIIFQTLVPKRVGVPAAVHKLLCLSEVSDSRRYNLNHFANSQERLTQIMIDGWTGWKKLGVYDDDGYHDETEHVQQKSDGEKSNEYVKAESGRIQTQEEQLRSLFELFWEPYSELDTSKARFNVGMIAKVFQIKNRRFAVMVEKDSYHYTRQIGLYKSHYTMKREVYFLMSFSPENPQYNYVCPGRELIINQGIQLFVGDDLCGKADPNDLYGYTGWLSEGYDDNPKFDLLTADKYSQNRNNIKRFNLNLNTQESMEQARKKLKENIAKAFKNGKCVRHGITFGNTIEYAGLKITGPKIKDFCVKENVIFQERIDFIVTWKAYVDFALGIQWDYNYYPHTYTLEEGNTKLGIGKVKLKVSYKGRRHYMINGFVVKDEDVKTLCQEAIKHSSQKSFDAWVKLTSEYELTLQHFVKKGFVVINVPTKTDDCDLRLDEKLKCSIPIRLESDGLHITIGKNDYKVRNKKSLVKLATANYGGYYGQGNLQTLVSQIYKSVSKIQDGDVAILLKEGVKRYRKIVIEQKKLEKAKTKKSLEFIQHAVKICKAQPVKDGWLVRGKSKVMYYVDMDLGVYVCKKTKGTWKNDDYLCLVDVDTDTDTKWGKNDAVAKRILMLKNDLRLASEIYEEGDQMDRFWLDLVRHGKANT